jgi:hypothetical protein
VRRRARMWEICGITRARRVTTSRAGASCSCSDAGKVAGVVVDVMFRLRRGEGNALLCKRGPVQWAEVQWAEREVECDEKRRARGV